MKYSFWFKTAIVFQFVTAGLHSLSFVAENTPANEQERQLLDLMVNYKFDMGAGYMRSVDQLMTSFSIAFVLLLLFSATLNLFLLKSNLAPGVFKGVILINIATYFACFITMLLLAFLPPIVCIGLILLTLLMSFIRLKPLSSANI